MWALVIKCVNVALLTLFAVTLGSSLKNLSFSTLLSGSIASVLSSVTCWVALVAGAWALYDHLTGMGKWRGLPWLVLGAAIGCFVCWAWNSWSGNASAVCAGISFLADVCGGKITQYVFMALFMISVVAQFAVWRYAVNAIMNGDQDRLFHVASAEQHSHNPQHRTRPNPTGNVDPMAGANDEPSVEHIGPGGSTLGHAAPHSYMHLPHGTKEQEAEEERLKEIMAKGD
ncbi:hypothetical protein JCM3770_003782 [Rhodotorula araucariae]